MAPRGVRSDRDRVRIRRFLSEARGSGLLDEATFRSLSDSLDRPFPVPVPPRPDVVAASSVPSTVVPFTPGPVGAPVGALAPIRRVPKRPAFKVRAPATVEPPAWRAWTGRMREMVASDVALHGLAYLGVFLMFTGVFGFVVFAFGGLDPLWRPVAEAAIPSVFFAGAWFLRKQRAPHVADALQLLGGLTLPIVAYASFVDDGAVPPDPVGTSLVVALTAVSLATAGVYYLWWRRHEESPLRFLIVPMLWMSVWAIGVSLGDPIVDGFEIRQPNAAQMALFTLAVAVSGAFARAVPRWRLARPTLVAVGPGLALGYGLTMAAASVEGWPAWSIALAGAAAVAGIDLLGATSSRSRITYFRLAQVFVAAATTLALSEPLGAPWAGVVGVVVAIGLFERWRRTGLAPPEGFALAVGSGLALIAATGEGWPLLVAWSTAGLWLHVRQHGAEEGEATWMRPSAAIVPIGAAAGLFAVFDGDTAVLVAALVVAAAAAVYRTIGRSTFEAWWLTGAAAAISVSTAVVAAIDGTTVTLGLASLLAVAVLAVAPRSAPLRVWCATGAAVWSAALWMEILGLPDSVRAPVVAVVGASVAVVATLLRRPMAAHVEAAGSATVAIAVAAGWATGGELVALTAWTVVLSWCAIGTERARDPLMAGLSRVGWIGPVALWLPMVLLAASVPALVLEAGHEAGWIDGPVSAGTALAGLALAAGASTWFLASLRRPARVASDAAVLLGMAALGLTLTDPWPFCAAACATIAAVAILRPAVRRPVDVWLAWGVSAPLTLRLAEVAGVPDDRLFAVGICWGALALVGSLAADDVLAGRRTSGEGVRTPWLLAPAVLGAVGVSLGIVAAVSQPVDVQAPWLLVGAVVALTVALQLRIGAVSGLAWALAAIGGAELAREALRQDPWIAVAVAVVPAVIGVAMRRREPEGIEMWRRWSAPALAAAHAITVVGLVLAVDVDDVAPTWLAAAALSFALGVAMRGPAWFVAGDALALVAAYDLGPTWFAIALGLSATASWLAAARSVDVTRGVLQGVGVAFWAAAWSTTIEAAGWADTSALRASAIAGGAIALAAAVAVRSRRIAVDWLVPLAVLAATGVAWSVVGLHTAGATSGDAWVLAGALGAVAVSLAMSASPAQLELLRDAASVALLAAGAEILFALDPTIALAVAAAVTASLIALGVALVLWRASRLTWVRPLVVLGALAAAGAVPLASLAWPTRAPLVAALLALAAESAAAGLLFRGSWFLGAAPVLACASWLTWASSSLTGEPMWFTVPVGVTVLMVVEVIRWDRRQRHQAVKTSELVEVELLAMALVLGVAPVRIVMAEPWAGLAGACLGVAVAAWGVETRVRRRLWAGVAAVAACMILMVAVPLVRYVPDIAGSMLWLVLAGLGALVVAAATLIERSRPRLRAAMHHLHDRLDDWE